MAPIKIIMTIGIALMLLQAIAMFFRDVATLRGETLE
jgi:TRAP-type mannitol/chloroaromatic compound transport system permease small subunit